MNRRQRRQASREAIRASALSWSAHRAHDAALVEHARRLHEAARASEEQRRDDRPRRPRAMNPAIMMACMAIAAEADQRADAGTLDGPTGDETR